MSYAKCLNCHIWVHYVKTKGARLNWLHCPACGGELEGYSYRKHGWVPIEDRNAKEAVIV